MDSYVIISTERLALQVFGRCPIALCATCDIDGCGKMSLQANIFPYGRITSRASTALKMPRVSENIASQYCGDIPPPAFLWYNKRRVQRTESREQRAEGKGQRAEGNAKRLLITSEIQRLKI